MSVLESIINLFQLFLVWDKNTEVHNLSPWSCPVQSPVVLVSLSLLSWDASPPPLHPFVSPPFVPVAGRGIVSWCPVETGAVSLVPEIHLIFPRPEIHVPACAPYRECYQPKVIILASITMTIIILTCKLYNIPRIIKRIYSPQKNVCSTHKAHVRTG